MTFSASRESNIMKNKYTLIDLSDDSGLDYPLPFIENNSAQRTSLLPKVSGDLLYFYEKYVSYHFKSRMSTLPVNFSTQETTMISEATASQLMDIETDSSGNCYILQRESSRNYLQIFHNN